MGKTKLVSLVVLSTMFFSPTLTSCGVDLSNIVVSGPPEIQEFTLKWAQKYLDDNGLSKQYHLTYRGIGGDMIDTTITDWSSGTTPDIFCFACDKTQPLVAAGALARVPTATAEYMQENLLPLGIDSATFNKNIYAYPYTTSNGYFMYYDKTVVSEAEVATMNFNDWIAKAQSTGRKIAYDVGNAFYGVGTLCSFNAGWEVFYRRDSTVKKIEANFNSQAGRDGGKILIDFLNSGTHQQTQAAPNAKNKVLVCVNGPWALQPDDRGNKSAYDTPDIGLAPIPDYVTDEGHTAHVRSFTGTKLFGVNPQKSAGNVDRMAILHGIGKQLLSYETQLARFTTGSGESAPTDKNVADLPEVKADKIVSTLTAQSTDGVVQANLPPRIWDAPVAFVEGMLSYIKNGQPIPYSYLDNSLKQLDNKLEAD